MAWGNYPRTEYRYLLPRQESMIRPSLKLRMAEWRIAEHRITPIEYDNLIKEFDGLNPYERAAVEEFWDTDSLIQEARAIRKHCNPRQDRPPIIYDDQFILTVGPALVEEVEFLRAELKKHGIVTQRPLKRNAKRPEKAVEPSTLLFKP